MSLSRVYRLVAVVSLVGAVTACGNSAGRVIPLNPAATTASPEATLILPSGPTPSASAPAQDPVIGTMHDILTQLNSDTAATAQGEYLVLGGLREALRQRIEGLLMAPPQG